ncbi:MAG: CRISPR-associated helicase Cas3' [Planctomycetota bacterium]|nr:CRISPR-associated helicase Cas3' [Planctomycetota bacterium]
MEQQPINFRKAFQSWTGHAPYQWQESLAAADHCGHRLVRIPTGYGKTLGILAAWLYHRVQLQSDNWPLRLVWALPMRVLVEQSEEVVKEVLKKAGLLWTGEGEAKKRSETVGVHLLLGGSDAEDWHLWPEQPSILIGTQDMLLSRALNRGYGAGRGRWPIDFGLLSTDCLWVLDEIQLMDVGLATAAQLQAFKEDDLSKALRPNFTWAMSATLQEDWLESPDTRSTLEKATLAELEAKDKESGLWAQTNKTVSLGEHLSASALGKFVLEKHQEISEANPFTLVVLNTVKRAQDLHKSLLSLIKKTEIELHLLHSRFRGQERASWQQTLLSKNNVKSQIIIATQVIEAGVDISAHLMFTEAAPWSSLVQRFGRLARRGGDGEAFVLPLGKDAEFTERDCAPYDPKSVNAAWSALLMIDDVSPRGLEDFERSNPQLIPELYPYDPEHLLLRMEVDELFDTSADLSGADLDISRFIRSGEERDVSVFWRSIDSKESPSKKLRPSRAELCSVPFLAAQQWLCDKSSGKLKAKVRAWIWDYQEGAWLTARRDGITPGQQILIEQSVGGYNTVRGWDPKISKKEVHIPHPPNFNPTQQELADSAQDREELSETEIWKTIATHGAEAGDEIQIIAHALKLDSKTVKLLDLAARWHDLGKSHPAFQGSISSQKRSDRPGRSDLAKAPQEAWESYKNLYKIPESGEQRLGFRHELASTLALFEVLKKAGPGHPALLGDDLSLFEIESAPLSQSGLGIEAEIQSLSREDFDLVAYLVCSHHGKLRTRLDASPSDQEAFKRDQSEDKTQIRGVRDGDQLPSLLLADAKRGIQKLPSYEMHLTPATLGLSPETGASWVERVAGLLERFGPFTLAWFEALLRAADVRASMKTTTDKLIEESK